jgi:hypothetical protein
MENNGWNEEIKLTLEEEKFLKKVVEETKRAESREKLLKTLKNSAVNVLVYLKPKLTKLQHTIHDSIMAMTQPRLTEDISIQEKNGKTLVNIEVAIFDHALNHFIDNEITVPNILNYIRLNGAFIGKEIDHAFTIFYGLQGKPISPRTDNQKVMYIIETLCSEIVDYTDDIYTLEQLEDAIDECLHKEDSDMAPTGDVPMGPKSRAAKSKNKLVHKPDTKTWYLVDNKTGKKTRITKARYLKALSKKTKSKTVRSSTKGGTTKKNKK